MQDSHFVMFTTLSVLTSIYAVSNTMDSAVDRNFHSFDVHVPHTLKAQVGDLSVYHHSAYPEPGTRDGPMFHFVSTRNYTPNTPTYDTRQSLVSPVEHPTFILVLLILCATLAAETARRSAGSMDLNLFTFAFVLVLEYFVVYHPRTCEPTHVSVFGNYWIVNVDGRPHLSAGLETAPLQSYSCSVDGARNAYPTPRVDIIMKLSFFAYLFWTILADSARRRARSSHQI